MENGVTLFQVEGPKALLLAGAVGAGYYFKDDIASGVRDIGTSLALVAGHFFGRQQQQPVIEKTLKSGLDVVKEYLNEGRSTNAIALRVYNPSDAELNELFVDGQVDESKLAELLATKQRAASNTTTPDPQDQPLKVEEEPVELPKTVEEVRAIFQDGDENQKALMAVEKELGELVDVRLNDFAIQKAYIDADFLVSLLANYRTALIRVKGDFEKNNIDHAVFRQNAAALNDYQKKVIFKIMSDQPEEAFVFPKQAVEEQPVAADEDFVLVEAIPSTTALERGDSFESLRAEEEQAAKLRAQEEADLARQQEEQAAKARLLEQEAEARRRLEAEAATKGPEKAETQMKVEAPKKAEAPKRRKEKKPVKPVIQPAAKVRTWEVFKAGITVKEEDGFFMARARNIGKIFAVVLFPFTLLFRFVVCPLVDRYRNVSDETAKVNHKVAEKKREGKVAV